MRKLYRYENNFGELFKNVNNNGGSEGTDDMEFEDLARMSFSSNKSSIIAKSRSP